MALRPCSTCSQPCPDGQCEKHPRSKGGYRPARAIAYKKAWPAVRNAVLVSAGYICAYDGRTARTGDHVVPLSKGGATALENVLACCARCNTSKGDRTLREWIATGLAPAGAATVLAARIIDGLPV